MGLSHRMKVIIRAGKNKKGRTPRQVASPLTGVLVDASRKGFPCGGRPKDYDHGRLLIKRRGKWVPRGRPKDREL